MPRSRRRRVNDRRRESEQRAAARDALLRADRQRVEMERYTRAVLRAREGEVVTNPRTGKSYVVQRDGSLKPADLQEEERRP